MTHERLKSYASAASGLCGRFSEATCAVRGVLREDVEARVKVTLERLAQTEQCITEHTGLVLENMKILEIGPGQRLTQMYYFSRKNDVTGIDLDVIARAGHLGDYMRMLRRNGPFRVLKTCARKALGVDRRYRKEFAAQLGIPEASLPVGELVHADASDTGFPDESFDFVVSFSVFEHLPDPARALDEVMRVLKPGGGACISIHLYTSANGSHDPRIFTDGVETLPLWAHLRPEHAHKVQSNCYLNKIRLEEWRRLFQEKTPSPHFECHQYARETKKGEIDLLREQGELAQYSDDELLTVDLAIIFRKD